MVGSKAHFLCSFRPTVIRSHRSLSTQSPAHGTLDYIALPKQFHPKMKCTRFVVVGLLAVHSALIVKSGSAQGPQLVWAKSMGSPERDESKGLAVDNYGNVICGGSFQGDFDADPGPNVAALTSAGAEDAFLTKLDANGSFLWTIHIGNSDVDECRAVATDPNDHIYATGTFTGTIDFDPGPGTTEFTSGFFGLYNDAFVLKVDGSGEFLWALHFGGFATARGHAIATDQDHVYVAGYFNGTIDFDPSEETLELTSTTTAPDIFLMKLTHDGELVWVRQMGGNSNDQPEAIALAMNGDIVLTGGFGGSADFDPGPDQYLLTGDDDIFVVRLNNDGQLLWARHFTGPGVDDAFGVAVDASSNVYTTGYFRATTDFDPDELGVFEMSPAMGMYERQAFVCKLDADGGFLWAKSLGVSVVQEGRAIAIDPGGNVYSTGKAAGGDFDPGPGVFELGNGLTGDAPYISKLDADGVFVWAVHVGAPTEGIGQGLVVDGLGRIYVMGDYYTAGDFDPGPGVYELNAVGGRDVFLAMLNQDPVGLQEWNRSATIRTYPSPANQMIHLDPPLHVQHYAIIDTRGRVLVQSKATVLTSVDVSSLSAGIYSLVTVEKEGVQRTGRFVVARP